MTKSVVTIVGSDGEQPRSAAAKVEGLARPKCSSRVPRVRGGEDVRAREDKRTDNGQVRLNMLRKQGLYLRVPQPPRRALRERC
jgi:hypothetical protein